MIEGVSIQEIMAVSVILFFIGVYGFLTRRNLISILISLDLLLNAVALNMAAINRYLHPDHFQGHFFAVFIIAVAAAEVAVAIAIIVDLYRLIRSVDVEEVDKLKY